MATHPNNVEAAIEHKRVSFGGEEHVQMIVYDDGLTDDYTPNKYSSRHSTAFTEPDAPPSRVKVTAETAQFPRPISPPAQIGPSTMSHYHQQTTTETIALSATDHAVAGGSGMPSSTVGLPSSTTVVSSPPLPSFVKRAEHDNENPFRPEEHLYHEVDPIVEAYRQRPFPPSPTHGSPVSNSHQHQQQQQQQQTTSTTTWSTPTKRNSTTQQPQHQLQYQQQLQYANGGSGRNNSLAQARRDQEYANANNSVPLMADQTTPAAVDGVGPPHKAEVIRLKEEKKKRACCHVQ
ncbi:hypothetical protein niasHS_016126 [Heterodera schachtii]|uniref:Uncharacterized protein n=1 Tax=Heterodera schachtii TaxID=97005 RepID=A0ABD2HS49_HETSC